LIYKRNLWLSLSSFAHCQGCVNGVQVLTWVRRRILDEKLNPSSQNCIVSTLTKTLNSNTSQVRSHLENFYKSAVAACNP
jgi:hypothetical protein